MTWKSLKFGYVKWKKEFLEIETSESLSMAEENAKGTTKTFFVVPIKKNNKFETARQDDYVRQGGARSA